MSVSGFHQFCILTKKGIEILMVFVYNVFIAVLCTRYARGREKVPF